MKTSIVEETIEPAIDTAIEKEIAQKLVQIEEEYQVKVLYACESGSRAWDFASPDSDYDVRFIYIHQSEWYLRVDKEHQRDVIELPIVDDLDINGWELQKALKLLRKSNPTLLEWIASPIVYSAAEGFRRQLSQLADEYLCPRASFYHYQHMASGNYREHLKQDMVKTKKYFYVLRPLLAMRWIEQRQTQVPMRFRELLDSMCVEAEVKAVIEELLAKKIEAKESQLQPKVAVLNEFIEQELADVDSRVKKLEKKVSGIHPINEFFLRWLESIKN
ncbi:nucleotidyltransferase domain-containing protein [Aliikangiella sp. G2MR2-5]|uniref:nucleotidyltransferase domain-containing protein n=1 Tax=Aliikangiella sp. G2MR2-5 TaxID=2788943 RepID=UPI0018ABEF67|nr:nucleotidyltransferase domain-containing protein [Aliikangiella sp. G2MR2-5]